LNAGIKAMSNRFVVDLTGVKLTKDQSKQIEANIQKAVIGSLADLRLESDFRLRFPHEWVGLIINPDFGPLADLDKKIREQIRF
jgi:hypothetical protein